MVDRLVRGVGALPNQSTSYRREYTRGSGAHGMKLGLRKVSPNMPYSTIQAVDGDSHTTVWESNCPDLEEIDHVTVYVDQRSRLVTAVVDYSLFLDERQARQLGGLRRCVQGFRPGSLDEYNKLLKMYGLRQDRENR